MATEQFPLTGWEQVPPVPGKVPPLKVKWESEFEVEPIVAEPEPLVEIGRMTSFVAPMGTLPMLRVGEFTNVRFRTEDVELVDDPEAPPLNFSCTEHPAKTKA
jgi:hypothetical protein